MKIRVPSTFFQSLKKEKVRKVYETIIDIFNLRKGGTYVDCGTSIGGEALQFAGDFNKIYCFEPIKESYDVLTEHVQKHDNYHTYNTFLSDFEGKMSFFVNYKNLQASSIHHRHGNRIVRRIVQVNTLDSYELTDVNYLKIDVEGSEKNLLKGAKKTLQNNSPLIRIEMSRDQSDVLDLLFSYDYKPIAFDSNGRIFYISNDLEFFEFENGTFWKSNNVFIDYKVYTQNKGFLRADEKDIVICSKETAHFPLAPKMYNCCQGDFWFIKR
jgi:FkbM family methyltransferase